jgi:hypothetical protein
MATLPGPTLVVTNYFADTLSRLAVQLDYLKEYWFIPLCMAILWLMGAIISIHQRINYLLTFTKRRRTVMNPI